MTVQRYDQVCEPLYGLPTVLELGSLHGHHSAELASHGSLVTAVEGRESNIRASLVHENVKYLLGDIRDTQELGSFAGVLCCGVLYHLSDPLSFLRQISSQASERLVLCTHVALDHDPVFESFLRPMTGLGRWYCESEHPWASLHGESSFWPREVLADWLSSLGFEVEEVSLVQDRLELFSRRRFVLTRRH